MAPKILAFSGSSRKESFNKRLLAIAALGAKEAGANVTVIELSDYPIPLFNQDLESGKGLPENARKLKIFLIEHAAFIITSPDYNSAVTPSLENVIDWASPAELDGEPPLEAFQGKMTAILAASPSALGWLRGLVFLRMLLVNIGVTVLPEQQTISHAYKAFNDDSSLIDDRKHESVMGLGQKLAFTVGKLNG